MGDPAGIGAECIIKALADHSLREQARFLIYGLHEPISYAADLAELTTFWSRAPQEEARQIFHAVAVGQIDHSHFSSADLDALQESPVLLADFDDTAIEGRPLRKPTLDGGKASLRFLDEAIADARAGRIAALVTGPINKTAWHLAGAPFVGHTELLAKRCNSRRVTMMFAGGPLKVALASIHVPLFELRNAFTIGLVFQPIDLMHEALKNWFGIETPKIAVAALNPHAGENGQIGDEETRVIEPAIEMARNHGIDAQGPFPADTLFWRAAQGEFDGVVAMYHDQALIPVKLLAFDRAVNLTLGLPIIRTSVDHGTAYDIAGKNLADPGSMKAAIRLAIEIATRS